MKTIALVNNKAGDLPRPIIIPAMLLRFLFQVGIGPPWG